METACPPQKATISPGRTVLRLREPGRQSWSQPEAVINLILSFLPRNFIAPNAISRVYYESHKRRVISNGDDINQGELLPAKLGNIHIGAEITEKWTYPLPLKQWYIMRAFCEILCADLKNKKKAFQIIKMVKV